MKKEWQEEFFGKQNELIRAIAQQVSNTIPDTWEEFYFHADINDDFSGGVYFFFNTKESTDYIYSEDIPEIYNDCKQCISLFNQSVYTTLGQSQFVKKHLFVFIRF